MVTYDYINETNRNEIKCTITTQFFLEVYEHIFAMLCT